MSETIATAPFERSNVRAFRRYLSSLGLMGVLILVWASLGHVHGLHVLSEAGRGVPLKKGPHEGQLRKVLNHHFELLVTEDEGDRRISVYLYDAYMKVMPIEDKKGLLYLRFPDRTKRTVELEPKFGSKKEPHFEADLGLAKADSLNAVLSVKIGGRRHNLRFSYSRPEDDVPSPRAR